ncbi:replicative helicase loader/inhibitor [Bacillus sp. FJAT-52991]|uniref:Replicative helicase loader/inhibitor n=1 Tax=Bacillus kandeliae TaxID=3129297 RepID=A0ABZ2N1S6_9BACI
MTDEQTLLIMQHITAAYPRFELTKKRVEVWYNYLRKMPYEQVFNKLQEHIRLKSFPPTIAEITVQEMGNNEFLQKYQQWQKEGEERIERDQQ